MSVPPERPPEPPAGVPPAEDAPTRAFRPAEPVRPVAAPPPEPAFWSLDSLRTGLALVGVLAVAALALAVWALLRDHNSRKAVIRSGPPPAQLAALTREVQTLSADVRALRSSSATAARNAAADHRQLMQLSSSVHKTSAALAGKASTQQLTRLQAQVNKLSSQLAQLRSTERSETTTQTTTTTTTGG